MFPAKAAQPSAAVAQGVASEDRGFRPRSALGVERRPAAVGPELSSRQLALTVCDACRASAPGALCPELALKEPAKFTRKTTTPLSLSLGRPPEALKHQHGVRRAWQASKLRALLWNQRGPQQRSMAKPARTLLAPRCNQHGTRPLRR